MKIICSGLQKTGTKSLSAALKSLGYNVYDFEEQFYYIGSDLQKIFARGWTADDLRRIYKGVDVVVDVPGCLMWEELHKAFPEAKIIHTERTSAEVWANSMMKQLHTIRVERFARFLSIITPTGKRFAALIDTVLRLQISTPPLKPWWADDINKQLAIMRYKEHNSHVREASPKNRTLFFKVQEGWEPICNFLGVPKPEEPFPHENKGSSITKQILNNSLLFYQIRKEFLTFLGVFSFALFFIRKYALKYNLRSVLVKIFQLHFQILRSAFGVAS